MAKSIRDLALRIMGEISWVRGIFEARTNVGVGESPNTMLAGHHRWEELSVVPGKRINTDFAAH